MASSLPVRPAPLPGELSGIPRISERYAEWIFREILRIHRDWVLTPRFCGTHGPWLSDEKHSHRTEGRLFARAYPALAERLAVEILHDPEAPHPDRHYAWFILEILAPRTSLNIENFLVHRAEDENDSFMALLNLTDRATDERCLALCRGLCRRGNHVAFVTLSEVADPQSTAFLEKLIRSPADWYSPWPEDLPCASATIPVEGQDALRRISILNSRGWVSKLERIILAFGDDWDLEWAIRAARRRQMSSLKSILGKRLAFSRQSAQRSPYRAYPSHDFLDDEVLVAFMQEGGELLPGEVEFLTEAGFMGNSEERLLRIVFQWERAAWDVRRLKRFQPCPATLKEER